MGIEFAPYGSWSCDPSDLKSCLEAPSRFHTAKSAAKPDDDVSIFGFWFVCNAQHLFLSGTVSLSEFNGVPVAPVLLLVTEVSSQQFFRITSPPPPPATMMRFWLARRPRSRASGFAAQAVTQNNTLRSTRDEQPRAE